MSGRNRISSITRWPLDMRERVDAASVDVTFFVIMREWFGERFVSAATLGRYRAACRVLEESIKERQAGDSNED